jgi:hypothetical protein
MQYEIIKAKMEKQPNEKLRVIARSLGLPIAKRTVLIESITRRFAPRGPDRQKKT